MNRLEYLVYQEGMAAAENGRGLSDCPYGGRSRELWCSGVQAWLSDNIDNTDDTDDSEQEE